MFALTLCRALRGGGAAAAAQLLPGRPLCLGAALRRNLTVDHGLRWAVEGEFEKAKFDQYKFDEWINGPTVAVVDGTSFAFQLQLYPKGAEYTDDGDEGEVRDHIHMGAGIVLVDGPIDELADFKYAVKVYKADGSLELKTATGKPVTLNKGSGYFDSEMLPMAADQLVPYVLGEEGSEFVKVRVEFDFPPAAFDALALLPPPAPRQDAAERMARWCGGGKGTVSVVTCDDGQFMVHKDLLLEASNVFKGMIDTAMKKAGSGRIEMKNLCSKSLDELIYFITSGATRSARIRAHIYKLLLASQRYQLTDLKRLCERDIVEVMQSRIRPDKLLDLLKAAETYELRVAKNVSLCRLLKDYQQLSAEELARFNSAEFAVIRGEYMKLANQALCAIKC